MSTYDLNDRGKGSGRNRGAQAIVDRSRDDKKPESRSPVSGVKGQGRSPMSVYQELKEISELSVGEGEFQPDTNNTDVDSLIFIGEGKLEHIKRMNRGFREELKKLRKNIESCPTDQTEQQPKQRCDKNQPPNRTPQQPQTTNQTKKKKDQSEDKKDHKSSQVDTNFEIITKAVSIFDDLQQYKSKMDRLAKRTIQLAMKEGDQPITDKTLLSQLERAIEDIEGDIKKLRHLETENSTYQQMMKYVWKTTNTAAIHVKELTSNNKGPGKFQIVKVGEVQSDEIDQFNQLVVDMIKTIEGFVDTRSVDEVQKLKREIERKVKENEVLHNRLTKLAGNKMTEGNPNIANLGDPNRPTKIAEVYSEIYDNEWNDTLDVCLKELRKEYNEDEALQALNKTLIICYKICQEKSDEWIQNTKGMLKKWSADLMVDIQSDEILMQIKEGRKEVSDQMSQQLLKDIRPKKDLVATKYAKEMNSSKLYKMIIQNRFFEKCFTLCWKMIVQNPRMILVEGPARGQTYDRNIFREFTCSGSKVVFTVWPALYLHEGGPLLVKGVLKVE